MFIKVGVDACVAYSAAAGLAFLGEKQLAKKVASLQYASSQFVHTQTNCARCAGVCVARFQNWP
jgi:hypothetical protein